MIREIIRMKDNGLSNNQISKSLGLCQSSSIYFAKPHKLGERAEDRLYGALPFAFHIPSLWALDPCNIPFVFLLCMPLLLIRFSFDFPKLSTACVWLLTIPKYEYIKKSTA